MTIDFLKPSKTGSKMRAQFLLTLILMGVVQIESFVSQQSSSRTPTTSYLFRRPNRNEKTYPPSKRQRLKQLVSRKLKESRSKLSILLVSLTLLRGSMAHAATAPTVQSTNKLEAMKIQAETTLSDIKDNKRGVALSVGAPVLFWFPMGKKKNDDQENEKEDESPTPPMDQVMEVVEELPSSPPAVESMMTDKVELATPEVDESTTTLAESQANGEKNKLILELLDGIGANPNFVYSFLGSSLAFLVSEDILVSGIAFAWIFDLFQESTTKDDAMKEDLSILEKPSDAIIEAKEIESLESSEDIEVVVEEYGADNMMEGPQVVVDDTSEDPMLEDEEDFKVMTEAVVEETTIAAEKEESDVKELAVEATSGVSEIEEEELHL